MPWHRVEWKSVKVNKVFWQKSTASQNKYPSHHDHRIKSSKFLYTYSIKMACGEGDRVKGYGWKGKAIDQKRNKMRMCGGRQTPKLFVILTKWLKTIFNHKFSPTTATHPHKTLHCHSRQCPVFSLSSFSFTSFVVAPMRNSAVTFRNNLKSV